MNITKSSSAPTKGAAVLNAIIDTLEDPELLTRFLRQAIIDTLLDNEASDEQGDEDHHQEAEE